MYFMVDQSTPFFHHISLIIRFQIDDILLRCGEMGEKVGKSLNLGLTLTPLQTYLGEPPKY